jgi:hypothetical protein
VVDFGEDEMEPSDDSEQHERQDGMAREDDEEKNEEEYD